MFKTSSLLLLLMTLLGAHSAFADPIDEINDINVEKGLLQVRMAEVIKQQEALRTVDPENPMTPAERHAKYVEVTTELLRLLGETFAITHSQFRVAEYASHFLAHADVDKPERRQEALDGLNQIRVNANAEAVAILRARFNIESQLAQIIGGAASDSWLKKATVKLKFRAKAVLIGAHTLMGSIMGLQFINEPTLLKAIAVGTIGGLTTVLSNGALKQYRADKKATMFKSEKAGFLSGVAGRLSFGGIETRESWKGEPGQFPPRLALQDAPRSLTKWLKDVALQTTVLSCELRATSKQQPTAESEIVVTE